MKRIVKLIALLFCLPLVSLAQQDFILYHMPSVPQITQTDPASFPDARLDIGMYLPIPVPTANGTKIGVVPPAFYGSFSNTGFSFRDIFTTGLDDSLHIDVQDALGKIGRGRLNHIVLNTKLDLFYLGFKIKEDYVSLNVTEYAEMTFSYPYDMMVLLLEGNGQSLVGKRADLGGFGFDFTHYREYAFQFAREFHHKFSAGARVKYLYGMENMTTKASNIGLTTNGATYDLKMDANLELLTSGLPEVYLDDVLLLGAIDKDEAQVAWDPMNYAFKRDNSGWGMDLGFNYHVNDKLLLEGSILDIAYIKWNQYTSSTKLTDFEFNYNGIDPIPIIKDGGDVSFDSFQDMLTDSLENELRRTITNGNPSYSTNLRTKIYLSGEYKIDHDNFVSLTSYTSFIRKRWRQGLGVAYNYHFKKWFATTLSYSIYNRSYSNVGVGLSVNLGPLQIYAMSDNVLAYLTPEYARNAHLRFGTNLTFGRKPADTDEDGIPDRKDLCPENKGLEKYNGCPDTDADGIPDCDDKCPTVFGLKEFGGCPDTDGDGIGDLDDECIDVAGPALFFGCPDTDGDSIPDGRDACPELAGTVANNGCPDSDGDGIIDSEDECPNAKGPTIMHGCPLAKLTLIGADGMPLMSAEMNEEGMFVFENLPTDKQYMFLLDGEDIYLSDEILVLLKNGAEETVVAIQQTTGDKHKYDFLPSMGNEMSLMVYDEEGNLLRTAYMDEDGKFVFENLPTDQEYMFKLNGDDADLSELKILFMNDGGAYLLTLDKDGIDNFEFSYLPAENIGLTLKEYTDEGVLVLLDMEEEEVLNKAFNNLEFNAASAVIRHQSLRSLEELAALLNKKTSWKLRLSGHTDDSGSENTNLALSKRRADAIKKYLTSHGITEERITVKYYGESQPKVANDSEENRQINRRVEMLILE